MFIASTVGFDISTADVKGAKIIRRALYVRPPAQIVKLNTIGKSLRLPWRIAKEGR